MAIIMNHNGSSCAISGINFSNSLWWNITSAVFLLTKLRLLAWLEQICEVGDFPSSFCHIRKPMFYSHALLFIRVKHSKTSRRALICFLTALIVIEDRFYLYQLIKSCFKVHELSQRRSRDNDPGISSNLPFPLRYVSVKKNHDHCSLICIKVMTANSIGINTCRSKQTELCKQINKQTPGGRGLLKG